METAIQLLSTFNQLLNTQPDLFNEPERTELEALITPLPNDAQPLANAIAQWCKSHDEIENRLMDLQSDSSSMRGIAGKCGTPKSEPEDDKNQKQALINSIRQNYPKDNLTSNTDNG